MNGRGTFCISIDVELLWGVRDMLSSDYEKSAMKVRQNIVRLLELFEKYNISATWAIVGHLFLDSCSIENGKKHPNITRPKYSWHKEDWFKLDPATNIKKNPLWYGKDIIEMISKKKNQEIGSHSFSHLLYGMNGCSKKAAEDDIKECINLAKQYNLTLRSFVFPRNIEGHKNVLKKNGIRVYRGNDPLPFKGLLQKAYLLFAFLLHLTPPTSKPYYDKQGLLNIPGSMIYLSRDGLRKFIPMSARVHKAYKGIDDAIKHDRVFHLWLHPINFGNNTEEMLFSLEKILKYANKTSIMNMNMAQIWKGDKNH